jgi:hypothetical protein
LNRKESAAFMGELSEIRVGAVRRLIEQVPDSAIHTLETALGSGRQDGPMAVGTRRRLIDRIIADNIAICGSHFPFPGSGTFVKDGNAYGFTPTIQS